MAYGTYDRDVHRFIDATSALPDVHALEVAAGDLGLAFDVVEPITITRFGILVTVTFAYDTQTTEGVVALDRRVAYGSDTGRVEIDTINLTDAVAAGVVIKVDFDGVDCDVGDQIILEAKTQAAGGGSIAGDWVGFFCYHHRAETTANQSEQQDTT
jgi:hypothetical protein